MAFGKNPENLGRVGSFRQMGQAWSQNRAEKKQSRGNSGGGIPSWVNEYKPPTSLPDTIRLVAGDYTVEDADASGNIVTMEHLPFWPFVEHFDARTKKRANCSAGPHANDRNKRAPCHGCDLFWSSKKKNEATGKWEKGFMGKRDMIAFTILHFHNYHKVTQRDQATGMAKLNPNTGSPYYSWMRCEKDANGRGKCPHCDAGFEIKFGHRMHWAMGQDHYNTLLAKDEEIGQCCANCGGRDTIVSQAWTCEKCGDAVIEDTSSLRAQEIADITGRPARCQCGHVGYLVEIIDCTKCGDAKRATLFDVDLKLRRIEPQDGTNRTTLSISSFSDPRPIDKNLLEIAKPEKLDKIYGPTPIETQGVLFGVQGPPGGPAVSPRRPVTASEASRPYGGNGPKY